MMKRFRKRMIWALLVASLLGAAVGSVAYYASWFNTVEQHLQAWLGNNAPENFMGSDESEFHTVASNSQYDTPTREVPVNIKVQVQRIYGLHLGTPVRVRLIITTLTGTHTSFDTLMAGILTRDTTTWRLYSKPVIVSDTKHDGFRTQVVDLVVAVWESPTTPQPAQPDAGAAPDQAQTQTGAPPVVNPETGEAIAPPQVPAVAPATDAPAGVTGPGGTANATAPATTAPAITPPAVTPPVVPVVPQTPPPPPPPPELWPFTVEFLFATNQMANGLDQWDYVATPTVKFGFAPLFDEPNASEPDLGFTHDSPVHFNEGALLALGAGSLFVLLGFLYLVTTTHRIVRKLRKPVPTPAEVTAYYAAVAEAERSRYRLSYSTQKRHAVRDFLGGATKTDAELAALWQDHPRYADIVDALRIIDNAATFGWMIPTEEREVDELMEALIAERMQPSTESPTSQLINRLGMRSPKPQEG
jgi:hypothetical protein